MLCSARRRLVLVSQPPYIGTDVGQALMRSIALKEKEIERLSASPDSSLKIGSANEENLQLNQQVDFLTQEMVTLESQLKRYRYGPAATTRRPYQ